ncbi:MAG: homocysteine S-methyltransferase family protein [Chloroflexota bacterium]
MISFSERLKDPRPIILDGATGTELNRRGVNTDLPLWSAGAMLNAPEILQAVHLDYLRAGAEVLTTNTFRAHRRSLAKAGIGDQAGEIVRQAVEIAKNAIHKHQDSGGHPAWVAGSVAPLEDCYSPDLVPVQEDCILEHAEMVNNLVTSGVDLLLIETMNTIREAEAAAMAAQKSNLPFVVSFVLRSDGNLFSSESLAEAVEVIEPYEPIMLGINCTPSTTITNSLRELQALTDLPISAYGNIGHTDEIAGWTSTNDVTAIEYGQIAKDWHKMNLRMLGGCCGTGPTHIQAVQKATLEQV